MVVTSIDPFFNGPAYHRRFDSDNDSAISLSLDNAEAEKQSFQVACQRAAAYSNNHYERTSWTWRSFFTAPVYFVLPSFISNRLRGAPPEVDRSASAAALDGLRGIATLIVFNERLMANYVRPFPTLDAQSSSDSSPLRWPVIQLLWSSTTMINIFFVISGYVLSYKPLRQMHSGNTSDALRIVSSSTIRRGFRLYLPTLFAVLAMGILSHLGAFDKARQTFEFVNNLYELQEESPPRLLRLDDQLKDVVREALRLFDMRDQHDQHGHAGGYDSFAWIVPVEFRNSMIVLFWLFAASRLRARFRLTTTVALLAFSFMTNNLNMALFLSGLLLADLDQMRFAQTRYFSYSSYYHETSSKLLTFLSPRSPSYPLLFIVGLLLCSVHKSGANDDPVSRYLCNMIPSFMKHREYWIHAAGSVLVVWSIANSTWLRRPFINGFARYFGKISFSLYLVHGSIIKIFLHSCIPIFYRNLGDGTKQGQTPGHMTVAWFLGMVMCFPLSVWTADLFWRMVDAPSTAFARWFESYVSEKDELGSPGQKRWD